MIPEIMLSIAITALLLCASVPAKAANETAPAEPMSVWFVKPANSFHESCVLGNGRLGVMDLGGVASERMVLNAAFLLEKEHQADFDAALRALDGEMGKRLIFKYVGPVPPYNFVNIVVSWDEE